MPRLIIEQPGCEPAIYELVKSPVTIGRSERNDLVLADSNASRVHAIVEAVPEGYKITDQNSRNGILVNEARCREAMLKNGSVIRIGECRLRFEDTSASPWGATTLLERQPEPVAVPRELESDDFVKATAAFRRSAFTTPAAANLSDLRTQLRDSERRALLFEVIIRARRLFEAASAPSDVLDRIPRLIFSAMPAERVVVMLWDEQKECLLPAAVHAREGSPPGGADLGMSRTLLNSVLRSRKGVLVQDARTDPQLSPQHSVVISGLRSALCVPMTVEDRLYGIVYADNRRIPFVFEKDELELLSILAQEGANALHAAHLREEYQRQEQARQAYRRFLPEHLAELLASHPESVALGGAVQPVTALFSDLRGFTALAERINPEEAVSLLNSFFSEMTAVVFRHSGTLDKFLGDGLLAIFGAPFADPAHPLKAVECAIEMQATLDELAAEWQAQGRPVIPMGIGINSGDAIVGNIGSARHMEYTVIGDTVNVAARLTSNAGPGEILIGENTWRHVQGHVGVEALPPLQLKGKREPVVVHRVLRAAAAAATAGK